MSIEIAGYTINSKTHSSTISAIYEATSLHDGRKVVIKTLDAKFPHIRDIGRLQREFDIYQTLGDINEVIDVYTIETHGNNNLAIVMEPHGVSLADYIERQRGVPVKLEWFLEFAINLANGIGAVHKKNIVHKDIVPRNILLIPETNNVRLIDFGIASRLSRERQNGNSTQRLEGSLPYISPEQTGRMNRDVDYRSDYYSLGMTLFELLAGRLPFEAESALEWVHCHISKKPIAPGDINLQVPKMVSDIVLKLINKNVEERYQSIHGLIDDLKNCAKQLKDTGRIEKFELGTKDHSEIFQIPQRLYGRDKELRELFKCFDLATNGARQFCLVAGFSGVGKSALVNEISKPIVQARGFFAYGKFDQLQRSAPYSAISSAFGDLIDQLLCLPQEELEKWKEKFQNVLGANAQIVVDLVPALEKIIGRQSDVVQLPPEEAQNRLLMVFQSFIQQFASADHPLVLFVDDLQWCDAPTLSLIRKLITSQKISHFLLIGAYRDNEVGVGHPLSLLRDELSQSLEIYQLDLQPLERSSVEQIVIDTLRSDRDSCAELVDMLYQKVEGNPFYLTELLKVLHSDELFVFDARLDKWTWDIKAVAKADFGDSAVDFMISNLRRLPEVTRKILEVAACIGNRFDLRLLATIHKHTPAQIGAGLVEALKKGLIVPLDEDYKFVAGYSDNTKSSVEEFNPLYKFQHDRVQEAAYALIEDGRKVEMHLDAGRLILQQAKGAQLDERLSEITTHLNLGRSLINDSDELIGLAKLNLQSGIKARDVAAYQIALRYLEVGLEILPVDAWQNHYELTLPLKTEYSRCAYMNGRLQDADQGTSEILENAKSSIEQADILAMRTRQYATIGRMEDSIQAAIQGLNILGVKFPESPDESDVKREMDAVKVNLGKRKIADLINAPTLKDREKIAATELLMEIFPAAFLSGSGTLFPYLVLKSVNLSLTQGNCPQAAFSYAAYGMLLCGMLDDPATGYEYGKLAIAINERFDDIQLKSRVIYVYGMFIHHWSNHWASLTQWFKKGIETGRQSGDLLYLAYSAQDCIIWDPSLDLETASAEQRKYLDIVRECDYQDSLDSGTLFLQMQLNFQGLTEDRYSLSDANFDESSCIEGMKSRKFMTGIANYHIYKLEICCLYSDYDRALIHISEQDKLINSSMSLPQLVRFTFISFLTHTAIFPTLNEQRKKIIYQRLCKELESVSAWAKNCSENFLHLQLAMRAQIAVIDGRADDAIPLYLKAIEAAHQNNFRRDEAMINELVGRHFLELGLSRAANDYLQSALRLYYHWCAHEKVTQMLEVFPDLTTISQAASSDLLTISQTGSMTVTQDDIDLGSLMKASQVISEEIVLSKLWEIVMDILLENAGAQCGYFVSSLDGNLTLSACSGVVDNDITQDISKILPVSVINFAMRANEYVIINNAANDSRFADDPCIVVKKHKSILCIPVVRSEQFEGVIYLENNLVAGAFSQDRMEVIRMLATQAIISLENAQLYESLENKVEVRTRELSEKSNALEQLSNQLSKYLSPQVYKSIFDNKQEVRLVSERKRLSVFFSDLVGFTETADRLESEELTQLLNHYLTEMSQIALEHGATIDKFIGDAIVIFFGDPISQGIKEDALACVTMAIAMRKRMSELISDWRKMGIEKPLRCRMGINTGYCTVGNFGSEDRMDYTIIGGNVNIAARLESAATPDEIIISYETWALIRDEILCEEKGHINVKGVSHPIAIYQVVDLHNSIEDEGLGIHTDTPNLKIDVDVSRMTSEERKEAITLLEDAARRLSGNQQED